MAWINIVMILIATIGAFADDHECTSYEVGKTFNIQCLNEKGEWGPGPICKETGKEIEFVYGQDNFMYCAWPISDINMYNRMRKLIEGSENWSCRVQVAPNHDFYIPFSLPIWGISEATHLHIDNHMNFVFHADTGKIIGAAAYPVKDRFQFVQPGTILAMHGAVKWFSKHTFKDYSSYTEFSTGSDASSFSLVPLVLVWCIISAVLTVFLFGYVYSSYLRPKALRSVLKND